MIKRIGLFLVAGLIHVACGQQTKPWGETKIIELNGVRYECVTIYNTAQIQLWHKAGDTLYNSFQGLLRRQSNVVCAMNAGMFDPKFEPVGLFIEDGQEKHRINLNKGYGNFHLMPNGVFCIEKNGKARVMESNAYDSLAPVVKYATQSGPMLVINGKLHQAFNEGSKNKHIRNGIGVNNKGQVVFAISNRRCNFYDFASVFRDSLNCSNALYLDGAVSKMYNVQTDRQEDGKFGVIIGVVDEGKPR